MRNSIILFSLVLILSGCSLTQTVSRSELEEEKSVWREPKVSLWYYKGSKDGYHYFHHTDLGKERNYRISDKELEWANTFPFTNDRRNWKPLEWGARDVH